MRRVATLFSLAITLLVPSVSARSQSSRIGADVCPTITVDCPGDVDSNSSATFNARFYQGVPRTSKTYKWTVSVGTITSGQGTPSITVSTAGLGYQTVTATVEVGGDIAPGCNRTASCSTAVKRLPPEPEHFDGYGNIRFNDEKARLDNYAVQLQNMPGFTGYIVGYGSCNAEGIKRAERAKNYLVNTRGLDANRVVTVDGGCLPELQVTLWIMVAGIKPPVDAVGIISPCPACQKKARRKGQD